MHSIRIRLTALMIIGILISIFSFGLAGVSSIMLESNQMSAETLNLICENQKNALDDYLNGVQQSVTLVSRFATEALDSTALVNGGVIGASGSSLQKLPGRTKQQEQELDSYFDEHLAVISSTFMSVARHTDGVAAYYYRINPELTTSEKGFLFKKTKLSVFREKELTDISAYDPEDTNHVGWYYMPLKQGGPVWMDPYYNANLDAWLISYEVPIYKSGTFIGIVGIDIRYETLVRRIQELQIFKTGYFSLSDEGGHIFYHPDYPLGTSIEDILPQVDSSSDEMHNDSSGTRPISYMIDGKKWQMTYTTLSNGLKLVANVQTSEINASWHRLTNIFVAAGILILFVFSVILAITLKSVIDPLERLTMASRQLAAGNYDVELDYTGDDELGVLTAAFRHMRDRLKVHINDLSNRVITDALTGVKNKGAYNTYASGINDSIRTADKKNPPEFAIIVMDCDGLKKINDEHGHDKGDIYLRTACRLICQVFDHSPVFRIGGDEFVVLLQDTDYEKRGYLMSLFEQRKQEINHAAAHPWNHVYISKGLAVYQPGVDADVEMVFHRADNLMYEEKKRNAAAGKTRNQ